MVKLVFGKDSDASVNRQRRPRVLRHLLPGLGD
jgi:hypothetical protein